MLPEKQLLEALRNKKFSGDDNYRISVAKAIGGKIGIVSSVDEQYCHEYFHFNIINQTTSYWVPIEAVDWDINKTSKAEMPSDEYLKQYAEAFYKSLDFTYTSGQIGIMAQYGHDLLKSLKYGENG
jgi:hypothetical protein